LALQEEAIRDMARKRRYNEIYDLMDVKQDKQMDQTLRELNDHFNKYGVIVTSIAVTNVHLPNQFQQTMQEATIWQNRNEFNVLEQKYELRKIEVREAQEKEKQRNKEDLEKVTAEKEKTVAEARKRQQLVQAETSKVLAEIKEQEKSDVLEIDSKSKLVVAQLNAQRDMALAKIRSGGSAEADKIRIETQAYVKSKQAEASAVVSKNQAKCLHLSAEAEGFAAKTLVAKRKYEEKMRSLQTLRGLSSNNAVAISGTSHDNFMTQILANQKGGAILGINQP